MAGQSKHAYQAVGNLQHAASSRESSALQLHWPQRLCWLCPRPEQQPIRAELPQCAAQNLGRVHVAAFSDEALYAEMVGKAAFWQQPAYFGLDLTSLHQPAMAGYFQQARRTLHSLQWWTAV